MSMAYSSEPMNMLSYAVKVITLRILRWEDNPELSGRVQCHHQGPDKIETGELKTKTECDDEAKGERDWKMLCC